MSAIPSRGFVATVLSALCVAITGCTNPPPPAASTATPPPHQPVQLEQAPVPTAPVVDAQLAAATPVEERAPVGVELHQTQPSAACLAKTGQANAVRTTEVHRWVDAAGVTHYSDQAPTTQVSGHRVLEVKGVPPVAVEASGYDVALPSDLEQRAIVDALAMQRVFHDVLGIDAPSDMRLRIVFVGDAAAYGRLVGGGVVAASTGAYVPPQHTIYVRMQGDDELAFSILRHEITHALIHEEVGNLPVPLNEGLAEYFRRYRVVGMGGEIDVAADRGALVGAAPPGDGSDALVELLALAGPEFYADDRDRRYVQAYALVAVLMRGAEGTAALHEVLARQRAEPCVPVPVEAVLDARYPGGLAALAADWAALLRDPQASVRAY